MRFLLLLFLLQSQNLNVLTHSRFSAEFWPFFKDFLKIINMTFDAELNIWIYLKLLHAGVKIGLYIFEISFFFHFNLIILANQKNPRFVIQEYEISF